MVTIYMTLSSLHAIQLTLSLQYNEGVYGIVQHVLHAHNLVVK